MKFRRIFIAILSAFLLASCAKTISPNAPVAKDFNIVKFSGLWYEIAHIKGFGSSLENTAYEIFVDKNGTINVLKSAQTQNGKLKSDSWEMYFSEKSNIGKLYRKGSMKNSEFSVVQTDVDYTYALIFGDSTDELYILSRQKIVPELIRNIYVKKAVENGYKADKIVWTKQK